MIYTYLFNKTNNYQQKWFIVTVHPLSYGCIWKKHKSLTRWKQSVTLAFEVLIFSNFPSASILTQWTQPNQEPIIIVS